jgi:hypothetical protein
LVRFRLDRRYATLAVAVLLGAAGGSLLGFVTAPGDGAVQSLAPVERLASSTTRRPRGRFAGISSSTTRQRPRALPAVTAGLRPATTTAATSSTARPTTTAKATTSTTLPATTTTTTTIGDGTTTSSSGSLPSSTTSTT